jgi:hypothetical protein
MLPSCVTRPECDRTFAICRKRKLRQQIMTKIVYVRSSRVHNLPLKRVEISEPK